MNTPDAWTFLHFIGFMAFVLVLAVLGAVLMGERETRDDKPRSPDEWENW